MAELSQEVKDLLRRHLTALKHAAGLDVAPLPLRIAQGLGRAAMVPGQAMQAGYAGNVPTPGEMVGPATDMALATMGGGAMGAERGAVGAAGGRLARKAASPDEIKQAFVDELGPEEGAKAHESYMGIKAYHGSPHDFDKFDMSKIGTGEGAQAYGHGLYFAGNEGAAKSYRDALSGYDVNVQPRLRGKEGYRVGVYDRKDQKLVEQKFFDTKDEADKYAAGVQQPENAGRMYEVNINAHPDEFLDWDKPISQQSEQVKAGLKRAGYDPEAKYYSSKEPTGETVARSWDINDPSRMTRDFGDAGIKGIRYLDEGSRDYFQVEPHEFLDGSAGFKVNGPKGDITFDTKGDAQAFADKLNVGKQKPTHNYVVFDDNMIDIVKKYGLAGLLGGGGAGAGLTPTLNPNGDQQ